MLCLLINVDKYVCSYDDLSTSAGFVVVVVVGVLIGVMGNLENIITT